MPRRGDADGVFKSFEQKRVADRRNRWKTAGALILGGVGLGVAVVALPQVTVRGLRVPLVFPLAVWSIGIAALFAAGRAVVRLATGKYRSGRSDFGLPQAHGRRSDRRQERRRLR